MKHHTNNHDWASGAFANETSKRPSFLARHWQNIGLAIVAPVLAVCVVQFAGYVIDKANYDAEHSWKLRGMNQ